MPDPILSGAPGFILLTLLVALAAYLRQVSVNAQDRIEQIHANRHPDFWPMEPSPPPKHTLERLRYLKNTKAKIELVTTPLFLLIFAVALRAVLYALSRLQFAAALSSAEWLRGIDLLITLFLALLILAMWVMHWFGKHSERRAKKAMNQWRVQKGMPPVE